jgi:hypothetical protein
MGWVVERVAVVAMGVELGMSSGKHKKIDNSCFNR